MVTRSTKEGRKKKWHGSIMSAVYIDDQLMVDAAQAAIEEAKARLKDSEVDLPDFIMVKGKVREKPADGTKGPNLGRPSRKVAGV